MMGGSSSGLEDMGDEEGREGVGFRKEKEEDKGG